jgi:hypothetical protein
VKAQQFLLFMPKTGSLFVAVCILALGLSMPRSYAASLPPPSGYDSNELLFEDLFNTSSLDTTKWNPWVGDDTYGRWGDEGDLPSPYSGGNTPASSYQLHYTDPYPYGYATNTTGNHLTGGSGVLSLIASPSTYFSSQGYSWASAGISSYGKMYLPAAGGYVQWSAKMPDSRYGGWAGLWLLSANGAEFDIQESGYISGSTNPNYVLASNWHGSGGVQVIQDTGSDLTAAYHTYGVEYHPGQSWKVYLDGKLMATWTSGVPTNAPYQLLMDLEIASSLANGWHTVSNSASYPGPFTFQIDDMQVYSLSSTFSIWQSQKFNSTQLGTPSISGANATPAGDGVSNLMKYALDLSPFVPTTTGLPKVGIINISGSNYLTLTYTQVIADADISYIVQVSGDLKTWKSGSSYTSTVSTTNNGNGTQTVVVRDLTPISTSATKRFIQLEVTLP